jgi:hypothetical protein
MTATKDSLWDEGHIDDLAGAAQPRKARKASPAAGGPTRHIGCPLWWFQAVFPIMRGKGELAVALFLYRQRAVQGGQTVKITNIRLMSELGIGRHSKYRAIKRLESAGLISVHRRNKRALEITFRRRHRSRKAIAHTYIQRGPHAHAV